MDSQQKILDRFPGDYCQSQKKTHSKEVINSFSCHGSEIKEKQIKTLARNIEASHLAFFFLLLFFQHFTFTDSEFLCNLIHVSTFNWTCGAFFFLNKKMLKKGYNQIGNKFFCILLLSMKRATSCKVLYICSPTTISGDFSIYFLINHATYVAGVSQYINSS